MDDKQNVGGSDQGEAALLEGLDQLLTRRDVAKVMKVSVAWLAKHEEELPFAKRFSPKIIRFSMKGLYRWMGRQFKDRGRPW